MKQTTKKMPDKFLPHFFQRTDKMSPDQVYLRKHAGFSPEETGEIQLIHDPGYRKRTNYTEA